MLNAMKCSNCSNEMVQSKAGWLCPECGHIEIASAADKSGVTPVQSTHPEVLGAPAPKADEETEGAPSAPESETKPELPSKPEEESEVKTESVDEPKVDESETDEPAEAPEAPATDPAKVLEQSIAEIENHSKPAASDAPVKVTVTSEESTAKDADVPLEAADLSAVEQAVAEISKQTGHEDSKTDTAKPDDETKADDEAKADEGSVVPKATLYGAPSDLA